MRLNPEIGLDTIPKKLNFESNPNIDKTKIWINNVKISLKIILILDYIGWDWNPDLCLDTYHKQLNFKFDQNIDKIKKN